MYSFPISSVVGFAGGIYAGEKVRKALKPYNVSPLVENIAVKGAHMVASGALGGLINALSADTPGFVAQAELSILTGVHHDNFVHAMLAAEGAFHPFPHGNFMYGMGPIRV